jgi:hypothetical protein
MIDVPLTALRLWGKIAEDLPMKVFISWSGDTSRRVAEVLREWLPSVIQAVHPYVSSEDIDKGARWSADISRELEESNYGILCVTRENLGAPWLNFEAGALSKSFDKSRVSPFLFKIDRTEVTGPLLQFQSTICERDDVRKLLRSINAACDSGLDDVRLDGIFEVWWPNLQKELDTIVGVPETGIGRSATEKRSVEDVLDEVLSLVRAQQKILTEQSDRDITIAREREAMSRHREMEARERASDLERTINHLEQRLTEIEEPLTNAALAVHETWNAVQSLLGTVDESVAKTQEYQHAVAHLKNIGPAINQAVRQLDSVRRRPKLDRKRPSGFTIIE